MASDNLKCGSPLFPPRPPSGVPRIMPPARPPFLPKAPVLTVNGEGPDRSGNVVVGLSGLPGYSDFAEETRTAIEEAARTAANAEAAADAARDSATESQNSAAESARVAGEGAAAAQSQANVARNAATDAQNAQTAAETARSLAEAAQASAAGSASSAAGSASSAAGSADEAAAEASLATRAAIAKMRERTGDRLWHNVALSQNARGQWVMDVDQDPGEGDGTFDADVKALGTTEARSIASRFADVVNVKDFGAVGDGVWDDAGAIQAAVTAAGEGATVFFPKGVYKITTQIGIVNKRNLVIDGNGSKIIWDKDPSSSSWLFYASGELSQTSYNLGADAVRGDSNLETAEDNPFVAGDWLLAKSQRDCCDINDATPEWVLCQPTGYDSNKGLLFGEPVRVMAKVSAKKLALDTPLVFPSYAATNANETSQYAAPCSTLTKVTFLENIVIRNFNVVSTNAEANDAGFVRFELCKDCRVENVHYAFENFSTGVVVMLANCLKCQAQNVHALRPAAASRDFSIDHSRYNSFKFVSAWYCSYIGCSDENGQQSFDCTTWLGPDLKACPGLWNSLVGCKVVNAHEESFCSHSGTYGITIKGCESYLSPFAVYMRSGPLHIVGCTFVGPKRLRAALEGGAESTIFSGSSIGIYLGSVSRFTRNTSSGVVDNGLSLFGGSAIEGNRIDGFSSGIAVYTGTCMENLPHKYNLDLQIAGNSLGHCTYGVRVLNPDGYTTTAWKSIESGLVVASNQFMHCVQVVHLSKVHGAKVLGNQIRFCGSSSSSSRKILIDIQTGMDGDTSTLVYDNSFIDIESPSTESGVLPTMCIFGFGRFKGNELMGGGTAVLGSVTSQSRAWIDDTSGTLHIRDGGEAADRIAIGRTNIMGRMSYGLDMGTSVSGSLRRVLTPGTEYVYWGDSADTILDLVPRKNRLHSLGRTGFRWKDVWTENGSVEARLAALENAVVNVKDFGAKGDGVTDDTASINAAITAAISKNASVYFPADTYLVSDNIGGLQQVTLVGDGSLKVGNSSYSVSGEGNVVLYASPTMAEDPWDESPQGAQKHGSTDNDGLTVGTPCDLQTALDVAHRLPFFKGRITVNVLPGTYKGAYTVTNTRLLERMVIVGGQRDDGDCVSVIDGVGGSGSIAAQNLNGFTIRDSYVVVVRILFKNWNGGTGVGDGDSCCGARSIESDSYFNDCDFYACGTGCYADRSRLYQGGGKVEECDNGTIIFGSSECSLGYGGATTYNAKTGSSNTVGITVRDCSSGVVDGGEFLSLRFGVKLMGGSIVRVSDCEFSGSTDSDVVLYTGASCYFGTGNVHTEGKRLKCFSAMDLGGSSQIYYDGDTQRFNFGALKTPAYKFHFRVIDSLTTSAPGATVGFDDNNPVIALNSDSASDMAGIKVAKPSASGEASAIYDIINSRWRFSAGASWVASISSAGIVRGGNSDASLGASSLRWKDVWTENGSAEARLAALEAAVLALDPNFVNGRS